MWSKESLFQKSKLYFEQAYDHDQDNPIFGLWCAFGLEFLSRAALANVSPALLALPDKDHKNLKHALGLQTGSTNVKSISISLVLDLCAEIIDNFTVLDAAQAKQLIHTRNEELHSGSAAFASYPTENWIASMFMCCKPLCESQDESLLSLFGNEIASSAELILSEMEREVMETTLDLINEHRKIFSELAESKIKELQELASRKSYNYSHMGHHKVECPSCKSLSYVSGEPHGFEKTEVDGDQIVVKQQIIPTKFYCSVCGLNLVGYSALQIAKIGAFYTRTRVYSPEQYYNMIDRDDYRSIVDRFYELEPPFSDWSND